MTSEAPPTLPSGLAGPGAQTPVGQPPTNLGPQCTVGLYSPRPPATVMSPILTQSKRLSRTPKLAKEDRPLTLAGHGLGAWAGRGPQGLSPKPPPTVETSRPRLSQPPAFPGLQGRREDPADTLRYPHRLAHGHGQGHTYPTAAEASVHKCQWQGRTTEWRPLELCEELTLAAGGSLRASPSQGRETKPWFQGEHSLSQIFPSIAQGRKDGGGKVSW